MAQSLVTHRVKIKSFFNKTIRYLSIIVILHIIVNNVILIFVVPITLLNIALFIIPLALIAAPTYHTIQQLKHSFQIESVPSLKKRRTDNLALSIALIILLIRISYIYPHSFLIDILISIIGFITIQTILTPTMILGASAIFTLAILSKFWFFHTPLNQYLFGPNPLNDYKDIIIVISLTITTLALQTTFNEIINRFAVQIRLLITDLESTRLENEQLLLNHKSKNTQLSKQVILFAQWLQHKTDLLNTMHRKLLELNIKDRKLYDSLHRLIKSGLDDNTENDMYLSSFNSEHPNFETGLKNKYPLLTTNNILLLSYIKLGIPNSEIASLTQTKPATVHQNKYRLSKLLNLNSSDELTELVRYYD